MPGVVKQSGNNDLKFDPHALANEALLFLYRGRNNALLSTAFSGVVATGILIWGLDKLEAVFWYVLLLASFGWHWLVGRIDKATGSVHTPLAEIRVHVAAAAVAGLGWGIAGFALPWMHETVQAALLVMLVIAVVTAMPRLVVMLPMFFAYTAGVFLPLLLTMPFLNDEARVEVAVVLVVMSMTLWLSSREIRQMLVQILQKQISFEQVSWEDRLTGLGNRRHFDLRLDAGWRLATRQSVPLSLIILDVDMFKKYNDRYGHPAGDECLRRVGAALASCVKRAGDTVARYGGEEFAVIMVHMPMHEAKVMGERMREAVMSLGQEHEDSPYKQVTISIGGATMVPSPTASPQTLIDQADAALYRAKEGGRNRVEWNMMA